jgi:type IV pilus assembly protein PilB
VEPEPELELEVEVTPEPVIELEPEPEPGSEPEPVATHPELTVLEGGPPVSVLTGEIEAALALGATAVHVVTRGDGIVVRARIGDSLQEIAAVASSEPESLMAGLAELAGLARAAFSVDGRTVELRPAVLPTVLGERVTFRVVDDELSPSSLTAVLDDPSASEALLEALAAPRGLVVLCSPLPDDRSALLHAALHEVAGSGRTIIALEDPVEHLLEGVEQVEVDPRAGVTFANGLHAILRSDADLAAVGELLDPETVRLATRGADARCLVVATLAAGTAAAGIRRLVELGADPETLASALGCVIAVRRVREVCLECRSSFYATVEELSLLGLPPAEQGRRLLAIGRGCDACGGTGLGGWKRMAEALRPTEDIRRLVAGGATPRKLEEAAVEAGMQTLVGRASNLCLEGAITASEVARLTSPTG